MICPTKIKTVFSSLFFLSCLLFTSNCSFLALNGNDDFNITFSPTRKILIIVDNQLYPDLENALTQYRTDLGIEGISVVYQGWDSGTAADLRALLSDQYVANNIDGAFLIGNLPSAWYEQTFDSRTEEFPCDLYFMDPTAHWIDSDSDQMFDSHSALSLKIFVSRLTGSTTDLIRYFSKLHDYRTGVLQLPVKAYVFKDDDWYNYQRRSSFGLSQIYSNITICENPNDTIKTRYTGELTTSGNEFVYQWIHSQPSSLYISQNGTNQRVTVQDVSDYNLKGLFYNLYDCSAARFTQTNLGMTYLTKTDFALAVFGSTKVGGCFHPQDFYEVLSKKGTWGDAYLNWYNYYGKSDDSWFLGMVILGDPTLRVTTRENNYRFIDWSIAVEPDARMITDIENFSREFVKDLDLTGFDAFKNAHSEFY